MAWYSSATGHLGVLAQDVDADGSPVGSPADDARHGQHAGRHARPHAAGGARAAAASTSRTRPATRAEPGPRLADRRGQRAGGRPRAAGSPAVAIAARRRRPAVGALDEGLRRPGRAGPPLEQERDEVRRDRERRPSEGRACRPTSWTRARRATRSTCSPTSTSARRRPRSRPTAGSCPASRSRPAPGRCAGASRPSVRFTVLDAGDPVKGAKVKVGGDSGTTDSKGRVTLTLSPTRPSRRRRLAPATPPRPSGSACAAEAAGRALASVVWRSALTSSTLVSSGSPQERDGASISPCRSTPSTSAASATRSRRARSTRGSTSRTRSAATRSGCASAPSSTGRASAASSPPTTRSRSTLARSTSRAAARSSARPISTRATSTCAPGPATRSRWRCPAQIVCREDCAGLCAVCGENLNRSPDHAHEREPDPRWAALRELKLD